MTGTIDPLGLVILAALAIGWIWLTRPRRGDGVRTFEELERERAARRRAEEQRARDQGENPDRL